MSSAAAEESSSRTCNERGTALMRTNHATKRRAWRTSPSASQTQFRCDRVSVKPTSSSQPDLVNLSDSEAVRIALHEAAARRRLRSTVRAEVRELAADERDREEMRLIREQLAELAPPLPID